LPPVVVSGDPNITLINCFPARHITCTAEDGSTLHGFYSCEDGGALPSILVEELEDEVFAALSRVTGLPAEAMADPLSILDVLHHVLADGEIAVVVEAGHEKVRTVTGQAWAIHASGARIDINAEREVVSRARAAWGQQPSPAHY
jgi:hypothetical protein